MLSLHDNILGVVPVMLLPNSCGKWADATNAIIVQEHHDHVKLNFLWYLINQKHFHVHKQVFSYQHVRLWSKE